MKIIESFRNDFKSFERNRLKIICLMFIVYTLFFSIDIFFTFNNIAEEGNPIAKYFISLTGCPLNLFIPYIIMLITLLFKTTWGIIETIKKIFWTYYVILLIFIIGHIKGVLSWT